MSRRRQADPRRLRGEQREIAQLAEAAVAIGPTAAAVACRAQLECFERLSTLRLETFRETLPVRPRKLPRKKQKKVKRRRSLARKRSRTAGKQESR